MWATDKVCFSKIVEYLTSDLDLNLESRKTNSNNLDIQQRMVSLRFGLLSASSALSDRGLSNIAKRSSERTLHVQRHALIAAHRRSSRSMNTGSKTDFV